MADPPKPPPIDEGLAAWAKVIEKALATQAGVELWGLQGAMVTFKFRQQTFTVTVRRVG